MRVCVCVCVCVCLCSRGEGRCLPASVCGCQGAWAGTEKEGQPGKEGDEPHSGQIPTGQALHLSFIPQSVLHSTGALWVASKS
jgi:hypothetical protein